MPHSGELQGEEQTVSAGGGPRMRGSDYAPEVLKGGLLRVLQFVLKAIPDREDRVL